MRILLTGTTTLMSNQQRQQTSTFLSFFPLLHQMLVDAGYDVDWRAVKPGERLGQYDVALLGLQAVNGLAGKQYRYGTLWAASQLPHGVVFDDWQVRTSCRSLMREKNTWKTAMLGRRELEERAYALEHCYDEIERVRTAWFDRIPVAVAPLFAWGRSEDFHALHPFEVLCRIDPTAYVPTNVGSFIASPADKLKRWIYAGLKDHSHKLGQLGFYDEDGWPLLTKMPIAGKRGWGRVVEAEVVDLYAQSWGVVSMPYSKLMLGTGWWRSRFNFAAQVGSVLWCDEREIGNLDPSVYGLPLQEIEGLSRPELADLAAAQQAELYGRWAPTQDQVIAIVRATVNAVKEHGYAIR